MKQRIVIIGLILLLGKISYSQDSKKIFIHVQISVNRTLLQDENTEDRFGFGLGAYHSFRAEKKLNIIAGLEFNRTSQFKKIEEWSHFSHSTNELTYYINCASIPIGFRLNFGSKTKFFVEAGGYADLIISAKNAGVRNGYSLDENNKYVYSESKIDEDVRLSNAVGFYAGLGVRIPISKFEIIVKPDYKFGINSLYSYQDATIHNRYFRVNIGLKIN